MRCTKLRLSGTKCFPNVLLFSIVFVTVYVRVLNPSAPWYMEHSMLDGNYGTKDQIPSNSGREMGKWSFKDQ